MDFCQKCSSAMMPQKKGGKALLVCRNCGLKKQLQKKSFKIAEHIKHGNPEVVVVEKEFLSLPKTLATCPKCAHTEALWWLQQTRSGDEAPTLFFRCTNPRCKHSWRQYS